jgi:hypothetical protein
MFGLNERVQKLRGEEIVDFLFIKDVLTKNSMSHVIELKGWRVTIENVKGRCSMEILLELFGKENILVSLFSYTID